MNNNHIKKHYELEKQWARKILSAPPCSAEREKLLKQGYDEIIKLINEQRISSSNSGHQKIVFNLARNLAAKEGKILDYGCGEGDLALLLLENGYDICGFDISSFEIEKAKAKAKKFNKENYFQNIDIWKIEKKYDLIIMDNVIEHLPEDEINNILKKCSEILTENGSILIITPHKFTGPHDVSTHFKKLGEKADGFHFKEYSVGELNDLFVKNNFSAVCGYAIHPKISRTISKYLKPRKIYAKKAQYFEKIFSRKPFNNLLKRNRKMAKIIIALFFPAVIVVKK